MSVGNFHMLLSNVAKTVKYQLLSSTATVSEGESFTITLNSEGFPVSDGTTVGYTIEGIDSSDITGTSLANNFTMATQTDEVSISAELNDDTIIFVLGDAGNGDRNLYKYSINQDLTNPVLKTTFTAESPGQYLGMFFKTDGSRLWLQNPSEDEFRQYSLTGAPNIDQWDLDTIYESTFGNITGSYGTVGSNHQGMWISPDGTVLFQVDRDIQTILQDSISAWNPLNPGNPSRTLNVLSESSLPTGISVKPDGTKAFVSGLGNTGKGVVEYTGPAFQANNWTPNYTLSLGSGFFPTDVFVDPIGTKMYIADEFGYIHLFKLGTPWELSTATFLRTWNVSEFSSIHSVYVIEPESEIFRITLDETDSVNNSTRSLTQDVTILNVPQPEEVYYLGEGGPTYSVVGYDSTFSDIQTTLVVPQGVTTASAVVVGGGGGGASGINKGVSSNPTNGGGGGSGGGLAYGTFDVTPGETLYLQIGKGGNGGNPDEASQERGRLGKSGGTSFIKRSGFSGTTLLQASGGVGGSVYLSYNIGDPGEPSGTELDGGGNGGLGGQHIDVYGSNRNAGGGGGAGGYSGNGGRGQSADGTVSATNGSGGGGAGGNRDDFPGGNTGGRVGIFESGSNGVVSSGDGSVGPVFAGGAGGGGGGWSSSISPPTNKGMPGTAGWPGAIRIIWGNADNVREYPSTNTQDFLT